MNLSFIEDLFNEKKSLTKEQNIQLHLMRLFNTRQGTVISALDYGLPDLTEIYQGLPHSIVKLRKAIYFAIEKYEPRLHNVHITNKLNSADHIICFAIQANFADGSIIYFNNYIFPDGRVDIRN